MTRNRARRPRRPKRARMKPSNSGSTNRRWTSWKNRSKTIQRRKIMEITLKDYGRLTVWHRLLQRLLILNLLLLAPILAIGQTNAADYFHKGVQYYIFGEKTNAAREIYTGLRAYPTDQPLNAAAKLLQKKDPEDQNKSKNSQQNQKQDQDK